MCKRSAEQVSRLEVTGGLEGFVNRVALRQPQRLAALPCLNRNHSTYQGDEMEAVQGKHADQSDASVLWLADRIRSVMPDAGSVREAVSFVHLVMRHPSPPLELRALHKSLWSVADLDDIESPEAAMRLRSAARMALQHCNRTPSGQVLEMALTAMALQFDDTPAQRMLCVDMGLMAAGVEVNAIDEATPAWKSDGTSSCLMSPGIVRPWVGAHVARVCAMALHESRKASDRFPGWSCSDLECALLALRMNYCISRTPLECTAGTDATLERDFDDAGATTWWQLRDALACQPESSARHMVPPTAEWHIQTRSAVRRVLTSVPDEAVDAHRRTSTFPPSPADVASGPTLIVCRNPILDSNDRTDKEEIARHKVLEKPLPLAPMPSVADVQAMRARLAAEFPWATAVLTVVFDELLGRALLGLQVMGMPPTLLVGPPGSGKSRLARRMSEELALPRLDLSLAGTSDSKVLGGTSRGWGCGKPNDLATLLAARKSATAVVLLDELDKSVDHHREGGGLQSYLLGLLEPETACRHTDVFLKTECDFSAVMWIATANRLSSIQPPLVSRLRALMLTQPRREHYPVIAENVLVEISQRWNLDRRILPRLGELELPFDRLTSARQVRVATEAAVTEWARALQRH